MFLSAEMEANDISVSDSHVNTSPVQDFTGTLPGNHSNGIFEPFQQPSFNNNHQYVIVAWFSLAAFLAIFGNTVVLISSMKYNAIHLDRVSIILIRNLAAADLGFGLCLLIRIVNLALAKNTISFDFCITCRAVAYLFAATSCSFLAALNVNKVNVLLSPLRANVRRFKRGYTISIAVWVLVIVLTAAFILNGFLSYDVKHAKMNLLTGGCSIVIHDRTLHIVTILMKICFSFIPMVCVVLTTIWMMYFVRRVSGIQRQTVVTLLVVSAVFFVSLAPALALPVLRAVIRKPAGRLFSILELVSPMAYSINCAANPLIYCLTIRSYGAFVKLKLTSARNHLVNLFRRRHRIRIADLAARVWRNETAL
jgi:hypothetical protein